MPPLPSVSADHIAILMEDISDPFFIHFARSINKEARAMGYKLILGGTDKDNFLLISTFNKMNVAGYIIVPAAVTGQDILPLLPKNKPVVFLDRNYIAPGVWSVLSDNFKGASDAVDYFMENGYRRIGLVTVDADRLRLSDRRKGYESAMRNHGLDARILPIPDGASAQRIRIAIRSFLAGPGRPDSLLFTSSELAFSGIAALGQLRIPMPGKVGVISFDDNNQLGLFTPAITALVQPMDEMAESILRHIAGPAQGVTVQPEMKPPAVLSLKWQIRLSAAQRHPGQPILLSQ